MVSKVVDQKVIELGLDDSKLSKGLDRAASKLDSFSNGVKDKAKDINFDGGSKSLDKLHSSLSNILGKIPILGHVFRSSSDEIAEASNKASQGMHSLSSSTEGTSGKFGMLEMAASVALGNIATKAIDTGLQMAKSMTIEPIISGWNLYEQKIQAVNMLTHALGDNEMGHITQKLGELQQYAQTTRYSIADMNDSLAQFVNAGVDIDKATVAIKGYGNLAASAGATTQEFGASLKFGVQQALQMGYMNRQNWMSIQNAHMATQEFKDALIELGKANGTVTDEMIEKYGGVQGMFADAMAEERWLTNDILMEGLTRLEQNKSLQKLASDFHTLNEASDAVKEGVTAAWSNVWETLFGKAGSQQVTDFWTKYGNLVDTNMQKTAVGAQKIAQAFVDQGGYKRFLVLLDSIFGAMGKIRNAISNAFKEVFPKSTIDIAQSFNNVLDFLISKLSFGSDVTNGIQRVTHLFANALKVAIGFMRQFIATIGLLIPDGITTTIIHVAGQLSRIVELIGQITNKKINQLIPNTNISILKDIADLIQSIFNALSTLTTTVLDKIIGFMSRISNKSKDTKILEDKQITVLMLVHELLRKITEKIDLFTNTLKNSGSVFESFRALFNGHETIQNYFDKAALGVDYLKTHLGETILKIKDAIASSTIFKEIWDKISNIKLSDFKDYFEKAGNAVLYLKNHLSDFINYIRDAISSASLLHTTLNKISNIKFPSLKDVFGTKKVSADEVDQPKNSGDASKNQNESMGGLEESATKSNSAVSLLTNKVQGFKKSAEDATKSTRDFTRGINDSTDSAEKSADKMSTATSTMTGISPGLLAFSGAIEKGKDALKGIGTIISNGVVTAFKTLIQWSHNAGTAITTSFSVALSAVKKLYDLLGGLPGILNIYFLQRTYSMMQNVFGKKGLLFQLISGPNGITSIFGSIKGLFRSLNGLMSSIAMEYKAEAFKQLAEGITVLAAGLWVIAQIPTDKLVPATAALVTVTTALTGAYAVITKINTSKLRAMGDHGAIDGIIEALGIPDMAKSLRKISSATYILSLATSVMMIANTLKKLSTMSWDEILRGIQAVGMVVLELTGGSWVASLNKNSLGTGLGLMSLAKAIDMIVEIIKKLSGIKDDDLSKAEANITAIITVLTGAMALMGGKAGAGGSKFNVDLEWGNVGFGTAATILSLTRAIKQIVSAMQQLGEVDANSIEAGTQSIERILKAVSRCVAMMTGGGTLGFAANSGTLLKNILKGNSLTLGASGYFGTVTYKSAATIYALAGGVKKIVAAFKVLDGLSAEQIEAGTVMIERITSALAKAMAMMSASFGFNAGKKSGLNIGLSTGNASWSQVGQTVAMFTGIRTLALTVASIARSGVSEADLEKGLHVIDKLAFVMTAMTGFMAIISKITGITGTINTAGILAAMGSIFVLSGLVVRLSKYRASDLQKGTDVLQTIAITIGVLVGVAGVIGGIASASALGVAGLATALLGMVAVAGAITRVAQAMIPLSKIDPSGLNRAKDTIGYVAAVLTASTAITGMVGSFTAFGAVGALVAFHGMTNVAESIATVTKAMIPLSKLNADGLAQAKTTVKYTGEVLQEIVSQNAFASLAGGNIGGWIKSKSMSDVADAIEEMSKAMSRLSKLNGAAMDAAKANVDKIVSVLGSPAIKNLFNDNSSIWQALAGFINGHTKITTAVDAIESMANTFTKLAKLDQGAMDKAGKNIDTIIDKLSSPKFKSIVSDSSGLGKGKSYNALNSFGVESSVNAVKKIADSYIKLANLNDAQMKQAGNNIDTIAKKLTSKTFKSLMSELGSGTKKDHTAISAQLDTLNNNVMPFIEKIAKFNTKSIQNASSNIKEIKKVVKDLLSIGDDGSGGKSAQAKNEARNVNNTTSLIDITKQVQNLANAFKTLKDGTGSKNGKGGKGSMQSDLEGAVKAALAGAKKELESGAQSFKTKGKELAEAIRAGVKSVSMASVGKTISQSIGRGIQSAAGSVSNAVNLLTDRAKSNARGKTIEPEGHSFGQTFARGIRASYGTISDASRGISDRAKSAVGSPSIHEKGQRLGSTYAEGLRASYGAIGSAAGEFPGQARSRAQGGSLYNAGLQLGQSFARGLRAAAEDVAAAAAELKEAGKASGRGAAGDWEMEARGLSTVKTLLQSVTADNINVTPTITPVLDVSQLNKQLSQVPFLNRVTNSPYNLSFDYMDTSYASLQASSAQNSIMSDKLNEMSAKLTDLASINKQQADLLEQGKVINNYMDSALVNKQLAPGMSQAQEQFTASQNRLRGILD